MHAAYRVIGPSAAGDRHFGVVFQRIFSASPGVPPPRSTGKGPPGAADGANDRTLEAYAKAGYPEQMSRVRRAPRAPPPEDPRAQIMLEHGINYLWIGCWALLAAVFAVARRAAPRSPRIPTRSPRRA